MSKEFLLISLEYQPISLDRILAHLRCPEAGAMLLFHGIARNNSGGQAVVGLHYEAHEAMALQEMARIAAEAQDRWDLLRVAVVHRLGDVPVTEEAVVIGVSAAHRDEAYAASRFLIEQLKSAVPVWKKEILEKGSRWVDQTHLGS